MTPTLSPDAAERIRLSAQEGGHEDDGEPGDGQGQPAGEPEQEAADEAVRPTDEPEPAPTPPPGATQGRGSRSSDGEPSSRQLREFSREQERHERAVRELMGSDVDSFVPCDRCQGIGLVPPDPQPRSHEYFRECDTCAGYGQVLTGSRRQGSEARDCPRCAGRGYVEALSQSGQPLAGAAQPPATAATAPPPPVAIVPDANGSAAPGPVEYGVPTWMGDPNVGR